MRQSRRNIQNRSGQRGATTVEMALVSPVLFLMVFGLFDLTYGIMTQHLIQDAARQGCRTGVCPHQTNASVTEVVTKALDKHGIGGATVTVLINDAPGDVSRCKVGDDLEVRVTVPAASVALFPGRSYITGNFTATYSMSIQ